MSTNKVNLLEQVKGYFTGTKAAIEALSGVAEGLLAYATDTNEFGSYDGSAWTWGQGGSTENVEDIVGAMVSGNTETGIAVTYDDTGGKLNFDAQTAGDARYAPIAKGVTNGDSHDHNGGDGGAVNHSNLTSIGTYSHASIDLHIDNSSNPHLTTPEQVGAIPEVGWQIMTQTWTYASADDPVYQIYVSGNATTNDNYKVGNKVRCNNNATLFYGVIVKIGAYDSGNNRTPIDVYGGTDYDLANSAITNPRVSKVRSPDGFPMDPTKWQVKVTDSSNRSQASPAQNTWYNLGSISISIPIGIWRVSYKVCLRGDINGTSTNCFGTLSTANNSETDAEFTTETQFIGATATTTSVQTTVYTSKFLALTSKTTYYLNSRTTVASMSAINNRNDVVGLLITADCAYL